MGGTDNERSMPDLKLFFFRTLLDWLLALRNQSIFFFFLFLIYVIFVLDFLTLVHFLCTRVKCTRVPLFLYQ